MPHHSPESTAYIIRKVIYPDGPKLPPDVQKRPMYIIGWTDPGLQKARLGVDCMRAYTYVSPYQIEEFEYKDYLARKAEEDAAEEREMAEIAALFAAAKERKQQQQPAAGPLAPKKRGRPAKKKPVEEEESVYTAPTLSSPQNKRLSFSATTLQDLQDELQNRIGSQSGRSALGREEEEEEDEHDMLQHVLLQQAERNAKADRLDGDFKDQYPRGSTAPKSGRGRGRPPKDRSLNNINLVVPVVEPNKPRSGIKPTRGAMHSGPGRPPKSTQTSLGSKPVTPMFDPSTLGQRVSNVPPSPILGSASYSQEDDKTMDLKYARELEAPVEWEVQRLEGVKVEEKNGEKMRYFKVRWKGNWPPDQNPSWEPEDCIDRATVKAFLKLRKQKKKENAAKLQHEQSGKIKTQGTLSGWLQSANSAAPAADLFK